MSTISCTINGSSVTIMNGSFSIVTGYEIRKTLQLTVVDAAGTLSLFRGMIVVFTDSVAGQQFKGILSNSSPQKPSPSSPLLLHTITVIDTQYYVDKRVNTKNYTNVYAGDIIADAIDSTLYTESITAPYSRRYDSQVVDFNQGTLVNTIGVQTDSASAGEGELDLAPSGTNFSYTESTTAQFATGSLTNCVAANNTLTPTATKALKMVSTLNSGNVGNTISSMKLWTGSVALSSSNYYLNYDIFIDPASPQATASLNIVFSDGTSTSSLAGPTDAPDGQGLPPLPTQDLTGLATVTWYNRGFAIGADYGGKTAVSVSLDIAGTTPGTYTVYIRHANFSNGLFINTIVPPINVLSYIFESTLLISPPQQLQYYGYVDTTLTVVDSYQLTSNFSTDGSQLYRTFTQDAFDNSRSNRIVGPLSVDSVKLVRSSLIVWDVVQPDKTVLAVWYALDDLNYVRCTNNAPLPNLPAGFDLTGKNIYLSYQFFQLPGASVEKTPILDSLTLTIATSFQVTKTDLSYTVHSQANWNTGTLTNLVSSTANEISTHGVIRFWDDGDFAGQDTFASSASIGAATYNRANQISQQAPTSEGTMKSTFAGTWQNFTVEVDMQVPATTVESGLIYRQTNFGNGPNNFAYLVTLCDGRFELGRGSNSSSSSGGTYTIIATKTLASKVGSWHRVKAIVSGSNHQCFLDDVRLFNSTDSTYSAAGYTGLHLYNPSANTVSAMFDNFGVQTALSGTWISTGTSLTSVGTYGTSAISWRDKSAGHNGGTNTTILVEASYDNGSTYASCTNGSALPTLTTGISLSGKTLKIRVTLSSTTAASIPALDNLTVRIVGSIGTITGTRSTVPLVNDYPALTRTVGSGWGTSYDGQTWVQTGTGATSVGAGEALIVNTTGDVHMIPGTNTWTDEDAIVQMKLSASTIQGGLELRYADANNYYRLAISTTSISIIKRRTSVSTTIVTQAATYIAGTEYSVRFRVTGSSPVLLYGRTWLTGTLEPSTWTITGSG